MKIRKHFRVSSSTIELMIFDLTSNRIVDKKLFFNYQVSERIKKLHKNYDNRLDKILTYIILHCNNEDLPLNSLSRVILSVTKITNAMTRGILSILQN